MKITLYNNLAACYLKIPDTLSSIQVCDQALRIDPRNIKALYRKAKSKISDKNASLEDYRSAIELLKQANLHQKDDQDQTINAEIIKITKEYCKRMNLFQQQQQKNQKYEREEEKLELSNQKSSKGSQEGQSSSKESRAEESQMNKSEQNQQTDENQKQFYLNITTQKSFPNNEQEFLDFFDVSNKKYENYDYELSYEINPDATIPSEIKELGYFLENKGQEIVHSYEIQGRKKEANELKEKLKKALAAKNQLEKISALDFNKPKQTLKKIAETYGINLFDSEIKNELLKIQNQNILDIRKWLDQLNNVSLNQQSNSSRNQDSSNCPKDSGNQFSDTNQNSYNQTQFQTQTGNNFYINNNFFNPTVHNNNKIMNNFTSEQVYPKETEKKDETSEVQNNQDTNLTLTEKQAELIQNNNSFKNLINVIIVVIAIILFALSLMIHDFGKKDDEQNLI